MQACCGLQVYSADLLLTFYRIERAEHEVTQKFIEVCAIV
jgi:hypothetical protein